MTSDEFEIDPEAIEFRNALQKTRTFIISVAAMPPHARFDGKQPPAPLKLSLISDAFSQALTHISSAPTCITFQTQRSCGSSNY
jgi:hypothetical protein